MAEKEELSKGAKTRITLYEFYALGIERLLENAPWELERAVSAYHESFLTEQRCLGLSTLLLLGEEQVPHRVIESMPDFESQARASVNQAVFLRALKHYFEAKNLSASRADMVLERMQSYLRDFREASKQNKKPSEAMLDTMCRRVPPKDDLQKEQYSVRVSKIYDYIESLVGKSLLKRYEVSS